MWERQLADIYGKEPPADYAIMRCVRAWDDLSTERPVGFSVGAIPVRAIVWWCRDYQGLDRDVTEIVVHVIRTLDNERATAAAQDAAIKEATGRDRKGARR